MRHHHHFVTRLMIAALLVMSVTFGACAGHTRVYDPYYGDYHQWNSAEDGFYRRWEGQTRRSHLDIGRRPAVEQHAYFDWRHKR